MTTVTPLPPGSHVWMEYWDRHNRFLLLSQDAHFTHPPEPWAASTIEPRLAMYPTANDCRLAAWKYGLIIDSEPLQARPTESYV